MEFFKKIFCFSFTKVHSKKKYVIASCKFNDNSNNLNNENKDKNWCKKCYSKKFQQNFGNWTSENEHIDKFIQESQLNARNFGELIEWIPYNRLRNIKFLARGGFSTVYDAVWLDGIIDKWDYEKQGWKRHTKNLDEQDYQDAISTKIKNPLKSDEEYGYRVVLKSLNDSSNVDDEFLNELEAIHKLNLIHGDFHNGNLLCGKYYTNMVISDLGLCRPANQPNVKNEIYGVLPYMAPEVLRGKPYTKAADIYSFGIIMWEMTSGVPAFHNV
ncbi:hypothetical protein RclHR1_04130004 [Rhizophagus clarus]|uniref:Protein kinase domain-containing protein n=1 Tax=Rhizophagus clarus TaxID=94130 RepID=A0A2Z6RF73_9GLOM|nr:hypothetical protein RclHR1_04130004 [Rhizophagus clarus]